MSDWQPIETAPDGPVLGYSLKAGVVAVTPHGDHWDDSQGNWIADDITHWIPLPEQPE